MCKKKATWKRNNDENTTKIKLKRDAKKKEKKYDYYTQFTHVTMIHMFGKFRLLMTLLKIKHKGNVHECVLSQPFMNCIS